MNPALVLFGIQSVVRLGRVTNDALEQWARDDEVIFPEIEKPAFNRKIFVTRFFNRDENKKYVLAADAPYAHCWEGTGAKNSPGAVDTLYTLAVQLTTERGGHVGPCETGGALLARQWGPKQGPLSPWARIILSAGDILLAYIAADPSILGLGGNAEKLVAAYARNLSDLLPDDGQFGDREHFAERLTGVFLRAGLDTIRRNPEWLVSEAHLQELIASSVNPLVDAWPAGITERLRWREVADTIMGPVAGAALETMARHRTAFLGKHFETDKALGALTQALFLEVADEGLKDRFSREGLIGLYAAALNVAAEKPGLFIKGEKPDIAMARELFSRWGAVLRDSPPPFDGEVAVALASASLAAVGHHIHRFVEDTDPWAQTAADMVRAFTLKFKQALDTNPKLNALFTREQLIALGRVLLSRIAESPRILLGNADEAWEGVLTAMAEAMKADEHLLLTGEDWIQIAQTAVEEAMANPGRLFRLDPDDPNDPKHNLAAESIRVVLTSAAAIIETPHLKNKSVLYGPTLGEAIRIVLRATSGHPADAQAALLPLGETIRELNVFVARNYKYYGGKEWLRLFRVLLAAVLDAKDIPELTVAWANEILAGGYS